MAWNRTHSERILLLELLLDINRKGEQIERAMVGEGEPAWKAAEVVQTLFDEGEDILTLLRIGMQEVRLKMKPNSKTGYSSCAIISNDGVGGSTITANGGKPFDMLAAADVILVRNAEDDTHNGEYAVDSISASKRVINIALPMTHVDSADDDNATDTKIEVVFSEE